MPTYEYRCAEGHAFEVFQRMSDEPVSTCPECGAAAERQISAGAGFLFKGDGFYVTDYRSDDYKKKASTEKGGSAGSKGESGSSGGGESSGGSSEGSGTSGSSSGSSSTPASGASPASSD
ncbi:MAG: zinc ribbon domain-containing protein [Longimicrobiales bacterium]